MNTRGGGARGSDGPLHGVRVVSDLVPSSALDGEPGAVASLLALERALSDRLPFRDLATQLHLLAVRR